MRYLVALAIPLLLLAAPNPAGAQSDPDETATRERLQQLVQGGHYGRGEDDDDRGFLGHVVKLDPTHGSFVSVETKPVETRSNLFTG